MYLIMSKYIKITENEVLPMTETVSDAELEVLKRKVLLQMKEEGFIMKNRTRNGKMFKRVAAAIIVIGIATPGGVYAAERLGVFEGLFLNKDTTPIEQYVENVDTKQLESNIYQMENEDYSIVVDSFVFSEMTDYGIIQFTVTDKIVDGKKWYDVAEWDEWYQDWSVWDATEIFAGLDSHKLRFEISGLMSQNSRCFMKKIDEQTIKCYLCFNDMKNSDMADKKLQLSVKESKFTNQGNKEILSWTPIMELDIPIGESLPGYLWYDEAGETALILTAVDFWLTDVPKSSLYGKDIILKEVSVRMKDGSQYVVHSDSRKIIDWFYSTGKEDGIWWNFAGVIDLEEVVSFTVDGKVFLVENALKIDGRLKK